MSSVPRAPGVTVAICCYNSASRLPETLRHLARQSNPRGIPWEVLVVDNASTDGTGEVALALWKEVGIAPLRVVDERRSGLQHARECARRNARFEILSLVDDDNWVCESWIDAAAAVMSERRDVAACSGPSEAVCEVGPPAWFARYAGCYAVGSQWARDPALAEERPTVWGAGMTLRLAVWDRLCQAGYRSLLTDRLGQSLASGGDSELCLAFRLAGWKSYYDPRLRLRHFVPAQRLEWSYLRRLYRGFGASITDPYWFALGEGVGNCPEYKQRWSWVFARQLWNWLRARRRLFLSGLRSPVADDERVLHLESQTGRLGALWRQRATYDAAVRSVKTASWSQSCKPGA